MVTWLHGVMVSRWSQAKFEISRHLTLNPIIQDQEEVVNVLTNTTNR